MNCPKCNSNNGGTKKMTDLDEEIQDLQAQLSALYKGKRLA